MEVIKQILGNNSNGQLLIYIPTKAGFKEGDYVLIKSFEHPIKKRLEFAKLRGYEIILKNAKGEERQGKVFGFHKNFVMLSTGKAIELDWIKSVKMLSVSDGEEPSLPSNETSEDSGVGSHNQNHQISPESSEEQPTEELTEKQLAEFEILKRDCDELTERLERGGHKMAQTKRKLKQIGLKHKNKKVPYNRNKNKNKRRKK